MGYFAELTVVELNFSPIHGGFWHDTLICNVSDEVFVAWEREYDKPGCIEFALGTLLLYPAMRRHEATPQLQYLRSSGSYDDGIMRSSDYGHGLHYLTHVLLPPECIVCPVDSFESSGGEVYAARHERLRRFSFTFVAREKVLLSLKVSHNPKAWSSMPPERMLEPPLVDMNLRRNVNWFVQWASGRLQLQR